MSSRVVMEHSRKKDITRCCGYSKGKLCKDQNADLTNSVCWSVWPAFNQNKSRANLEMTNEYLVYVIGDTIWSL